MNFNVGTLNNISKVGLSRLGENYTLVEDINKANGIIVRSYQMHDMEFSDDLLVIARAGAGVNNIPLEKCTEKGIVVFNAPGANANSVKELVLASLISASRNISEGRSWVMENADDADIAKDMEKAKKAFVGREIYGKKLGVIGLGAIGGMVANAADKLGMDVYGYDPYLSVDNALRLSRNIKVVKSSDEIYKRCDYITVHLHLTDSTRGMIGEKELTLMKKSAILLNFARGEIVDNAALVECLKRNGIGKYVTDFPSPEILGFKNVLATPHLGACTAEAEDNCAIMAVDELCDYLENGNIRNAVNVPDCDAGRCESDVRFTILHQNIPNMLNQFTKIFSDEHINIDHLTNKTKKDLGYCVLDIMDQDTTVLEERINNIEGVIKTRVLKYK